MKRGEASREDTQGRRGRGVVYTCLDKVPKDLREHVKSLLEMSEKGVVKIKPKQ